MAVLIFDVEARVRALASAIDAPEDLVPTFGRSKDLGYPFIEQTGDTLHWVVKERGIELERRSTTDLDELLYWIFKSVTSSMAADWEVRHRVEEQDFRILMFTRQFELLRALNPAWVDRRKRELKPILDEIGMP